MNEFIQELRAILDEYYVAPNGRPTELMKDQKYINAVKNKYIKRAETKMQELIKESHEAGMVGEDAIRGMISDVFFSYFHQDI